jgi:hypothetical protein
LHFVSGTAGHSSVARLGVSDVAGYRLGGEALLNTVGRGGRVFVIEIEPLLDAALSAPGQLRLTIYGFPNTEYSLEQTGQLGAGAVWTEVQALILPGNSGALDLSVGAANVRYFRVR